MESSQETYNESKARFDTILRASLDEKIKEKSTSVDKYRIFLDWAVSRIMDTSEDEIKNQMLDGANDMGIDLWIKPDVDSETGPGLIYLFQCKYGEQHKDFEINNFESNIDKFLRSNESEIFRDELKRLYKMIKNENLEPRLFYLTDQQVNNSLQTKVHVYGFEQIRDKMWSELSGIPKDISQKIQLETFFEYDDTVIGILQISELRKFIHRTKSFIYESNVRKYLQRTKVNKGLKNTLKNFPDKLLYYNNGITIVVKDYEKLGNSEVMLIEPQVVNGAQTTQTIYESLPLISNVIGSIQISIIKENNKTTRSDITRFRNSQNIVKGKDLISLEVFHSGIQAQLREIGYYYQKQTGAWDFMESDQRLKYNGHKIFDMYLREGHSKVIEANVAIQSMVAGIFQNPTKPYSSIASFMPNGANYSKIFDSSLPENYRLFLYPYLIKSFSEKMGYGFDDAPKQKRYARLLFVSFYFKILFEHILKKDKDIIKSNPEILDEIFKNFEANEKLLMYTNDMMDSYFIASLEYFDKHEISTWHNFFSAHAWKEELQKTLLNHIKNNADDFEEIKKKFSDEKDKTQVM